MPASRALRRVVPKVPKVQGAQAQLQAQKTLKVPQAR
jgi:hypothetical protein